MAQVNVIGRITADLELKTSEKSNPYVRFDIAENIGSTAQDAELASDTIRRVIGVANAAGSAAGCVSDAAEKLAEQAAQLDSQVRTFLQRIRQAA